METVWYVIDSRHGRIVNAITTGGRKPTLDGFEDAEHLRLDANPPRHVLEGYRYYWERP